LSYGPAQLGGETFGFLLKLFMKKTASYQVNYIYSPSYYSSMIIVIGGRAGAGKSTVARLLAEKLGYKHYSMGDLLRQLAQKKGISIVEMNRLAEMDASIDAELDERQKRLGKEEDNFVIDGRLSALFIPHATKLFLDADPNVRAQRIAGDRKRAGGESKKIGKAAASIIEREKSESKRFLACYDFDPYDTGAYDRVIDTTSMPAEDAVAGIVEMVEGQKKSSYKFLR